MTSKKVNIIDSVTPAQAPQIAKNVKDAAREKLNELIKEETRLVRGIFQCFESPGATIKVIVRKYAGIPHFEKLMTDGEAYEIPLYVARHLNGVDKSAGACADPELRNPNIGTCSYPVHGFKWRQGEEAPKSADTVGGIVPLVGVSKRVKRYGFQSMEFAASME